MRHYSPLSTSFGLSTHPITITLAMLSLTSIEFIVASLAIATAFSPSFIVHKNSAIVSSRTHHHFAGRQRSLHDRQRCNSSTSLNMMFDQLSSALTEVAQNFGGKQR